MISIIVPVYNAEKYIKKTIDSVKAQTYSDWELILVDDGSTDNSAQEILASNDERIRYVRNESGKKGAAGARNYGISIALGRYIAFIDADDIWQKDKLQKTLDYMERNEYEFVFTAYDFGDENAESVGKTVHVPKDLTYKKALSRTVIFTSTVVFDLNKLEKDMIYMPYIARFQSIRNQFCIIFIIIMIIDCHRLVVRNYEIKNSKISNELNIIFLTLFLHIIM